MAAPVAQSTLSPALQRRLAEHREEARRFREQHGDPVEYLAAIVRDSFDQEALDEAAREFYEGSSEWDDEVDER